MRQSFRVSFHGTGDHLVFTPPEAELHVGEGQSQTAEFQVDARRPQVVGGIRNFPFSIRVRSADGVTQSHNSQVSSPSLMPIWLISVLTFLCLGTLIASSFVVSARNDRITSATQTAAALAVAPVETQTAIASATLAAIQTATATASYGVQDDDRDGLTNAEEAQLNTLPNKRDTDEDGLDDGEEVRRGTDPLNPDSDGDGLKDGEEVQRGINPLNRDTDGDGTPDPVDPDPGRLPTATPLPSATVTPINVPPIVALTEPATGSIFQAPATITLGATPADNDGRVVRVQFFAGPELLGTVNENPFRFIWNNVPAGTYQLTAVATDDDGATTTSATVTITVNSPPNQAPTINLVEPTNGSVFPAGGNILIAAIADDPDGQVVEVEFYQGTTLLEIVNSRRTRYEYLWQNVQPGTYTLSTVATDNAGVSTTSALINITVSTPPNVLPDINLTGPANNAAFAPDAPIVITANASDSDGTVTRVDFFANGGYIGFDETSPYSMTWQTNITGTYVITADATDDDGAVKTSTAVTIVVQAPEAHLNPPVPSILWVLSEQTGCLTGRTKACRQSISEQMSINLPSNL
jgi:hypothetical protein